MMPSRAFGESITIRSMRLANCFTIVAENTGMSAGFRLHELPITFPVYPGSHEADPGEGRRANSAEVVDAGGDLAAARVGQQLRAVAPSGPTEMPPCAPAIFTFRLE